ncbi:hypothetical protein C8J27_105257 [Rhodobacter aestuarii]|uniref:Rhamnan synthesis protein F n=1 Tax=Rhodobacter aestuarii TaxID=453582 RepID=A0A1N7LDE6_9RHOB|nr:hypothetical protein [Rhodobacter aestuarii]PTV95310.1 hypothetical protein C8J27_105257 [Rhodobacter aestuarii]SIS71872.1 hypothetical protein SAMN05421580_10419 [Rhodobacter aestuarii]
MKILDRLVTASFLPLASIIVTAQSERKRYATRSLKPRILCEKAYDGRNVLLLALYEKGSLRPDVQRLLQAAQAEGFYVLAVNTMRLADPSAVEGLIDCYIERPNFGRDFASYRDGFLHLFARGWAETCPNVLMLNDSVFFTRERLPKFLRDMVSSGKEVLGSTENYDEEHHLGSFCITMANPILRNPKFQQYWKDYRLSDRRPTVIKRGEMRLSKTLKACVSSPDQFTSLYSGERYISALRANPELVDFSIANVRASDINPWPRASLKNVIEKFRTRYLVNRSDQVHGSKQNTIMTSGEPHEDYIRSVEDLAKYLSDIGNTDALRAEDIAVMVADEFGDGFLTGSHIHQNPTILLKMGLPIIKNDGVYRGLLNVEDLLRLSDLMDADESEEMRKLLLSRPYGGHHLVGWQLAAFHLGLL